MKTTMRWFAALGAACAMALPAAADDAPPPTDGLRHAVVCPPFKGQAELAGLYHAEMVKMLKGAAGVEYLEGSRALVRRGPEFVYRVSGRIETDEDGRAYIAVSLVDSARKEQIASMVAPASGEAEALKAWRDALQKSLERRTSRLPFESRVRRQRGQNSYTLDRGLGSGLQPGMVLFVAADEEPLISPLTGEVVGRDSPRALGKIEVFRVMENAAYARPTKDTRIPRTSSLYARTF